MEINPKFLIGGGVLILVFLYISQVGIPVGPQTIVTECDSSEDLETIDAFTTQLESLGNFTVSEIEDCEKQNIGVFFDLRNERIISTDMIIETKDILNETTNQTETKEVEIKLYKWCADDFFVVTRNEEDMNNYFDELFNCVEVDRCSTNDDCLLNQRCEATICQSLECVSNETAKQIPLDHTCQVVECLIDNDCVQEIDTDCDGELEEQGGECIENQCQYIEYEQCSSVQIFYNKFQYWIIGGIALIIVGIAIFFMRR